LYFNSGIQRGPTIKKTADDIAIGALTGAVAYALIASLTPNLSSGVQLAVALVFIFAGVLSRARWPRALWGALGIVVGIWLVIALSPLSRFAFQRFVRRDSVPTSVDAVVVLAAGVTADGNLPPRGVDRLLAGMALARNGISTTLVISRPTSPAFPNVTASADQERLVALLPPGTELVFVEQVTSTRTEGVRVASVARTRGWRHIAVVTSPSHTKRSCAVFERLELKVVCIPSESRDITQGEHASVGERLRMFQQVAYEFAAMELYRYRGWVR
jgi:uncharacterized SAM-binding protein YcdF (DUF218 family)